MNQVQYSELGLPVDSLGMSTTTNSTIVDWGQSIVREYDGGIGDMASTLMCSDLCPCLLSPDANEWLNTEEQELNSYGRTKENNFDMMPLNFEGYSEISNAYYLTFEECYRARSDIIQSEFWWDFGQLEKTIAIAEYLEGIYECSGLCSPPLFYFAKEVESGRPREVCMGELQDEMTHDMMQIGFLAFATGSFMFLAFVTQYCYWNRVK